MGTYRNSVLQEGDVVQIRIVRTDAPDEPEWQNPDAPVGVYPKVPED